jgi:hypothetical protein
MQHPDRVGPAVNVQAMVYGNTGDESGSGVAFTRNPANGVKEFYGEFLINARGEDVVAACARRAGLRARAANAQGYAELERIRQTLESTSRTSRTSSSRSRTASSTCCRRATASARRWRR